MPRPSFAEEYPRDPALDAKVEAFERGDYTAARAPAKGPEPSAARDLAARTDPDPAMKWLFLAILTLILAVFGYWRG